MASAVRVEVRTSATAVDFQKPYKDALDRGTEPIKKAGSRQNIKYIKYCY